MARKDLLDEARDVLRRAGIINVELYQDSDLVEIATLIADARRRAIPEVEETEYQHPVAGITPEQLGPKMKASLEAVAPQFPPQTGIIVFAFDFGGGGGIGYASNAVRKDVVEMLHEWIAKVEERAREHHP